jgi:3-hydroxyisobutyrate dehydrogenase-like beta-hydroxyacid dehydrogenase
MTTIGIIGLGIMGSAMARNLLRAGHPVVGHDVRASCRRALQKAGGSAVASSRVAGEQARIIITSLPSADALADTVAELSRSAPSPHIVIETSTLPIEVKERARARLQKRGTVLLDCPVSGTGSQARVGDIVVYASGPRPAYRRVSKVLDAFTRGHYYVGAFGEASKLKFVANLLVAIHNVAAAEAMVLAKKAGLDAAVALRLVSEGAGSSRVLQLRGPMMVKGKYDAPTMTLANFQKDVRIIAAFARKVGVRTPLFSATASIYAAATRKNKMQDTAAVCAVIEKMSRGKRARRKGARGK